MSRTGLHKAHAQPEVKRSHSLCFFLLVTSPNIGMLLGLPRPPSDLIGGITEWRKSVKLTGMVVTVKGHRLKSARVKHMRSRRDQVQASLVLPAGPY